MTEAHDTALATHLRSELGDQLSDIRIAHEEVTLTTTPAHSVAVLQFLKDDRACDFTQLMDIAGVDYPHRPQRFELVYHLLSLRRNQRVRVKVPLAEDEIAPSVCGLFASANWYEREAFDLYGIVFAQHPDLRRLLTDYGFSGHPLRKDFPLTGHLEVRYDEAQAKVLYEPVQLVQDFREFDFASPWEGALPLSAAGALDDSALEKDSAAAAHKKLGGASDDKKEGR